MHDTFISIRLNGGKKMALKQLLKEDAERVFEALGVVKATGKLRKGTNEVTKAVERGEAKLVVVAKDVNPKEIVMHLPLLCEEKNILVVEVPTREELGSASGLNVPTVAVAIVQEGDAKKLLKELNDDLRR